jgi:hypothetical protein
MANKEFQLQLPTISTLPFSVASDDSIPDAVKVYFSQLYGLCICQGYCWATDEQLAKMKNTSIKNIQRWNKRLSDAGHIIRKTKNVLVNFDDEKSSKWIKKRKIYCFIKQISIPNDEIDEEIDEEIETIENYSKNVCETLKNEGFNEPLKNEGSYDTLKNEGYKKETLNMNLYKEESASSFFSKDEEVAQAPLHFPQSLNKLEISEALKFKISQNHPKEKIDKAVQWTLEWKTRSHDELGIMAVLKNFDTWKDKPTPEKIAENNLKHLETLKHLEGKKFGPMETVIGNKYIEFVCGTKTEHFDIESPTFKKDVTEYLEKLQNI